MRASPCPSPGWLSPPRQQGLLCRGLCGDLWVLCTLGTPFIRSFIHSWRKVPEVEPEAGRVPEGHSRPGQPAAHVRPVHTGNSERVSEPDPALTATGVLSHFILSMAPRGRFCSLTPVRRSLRAQGHSGPRRRPPGSPPPIGALGRPLVSVYPAGYRVPPEGGAA